MSFIEAQDLGRTYGQGQAAVDALKGVDFSIDKGEFVAVMGPSGSGKSTLLSIMGGLNTPSRGSFSVDGLDVYGLSSDQRADFRREYLGFVFQSFNLMPFLTLAENTMLPLVTKRMPVKEKRRLAQEALERVGLGKLADRLPSQVSGGEQERAAVARALVNQPPILLADEPTGNLDNQTTGRVMELLTELWGLGMTVVMVTHSTQCASYASRTIELSDGLISAGGGDPCDLTAVPSLIPLPGAAGAAS